MSALPFEISPLVDGFGAEVIGVELSSDVPPSTYDAILGAFITHQLLLFRGQDIPPARQVELARQFGEVQVHVMNQYHSDGHPELYFLTNVGEDGEPTGKHPDRGTLAWHTDGSWRRETGLATIMYSVEVPPVGGETHFCNMYAAYEALTGARTRELEGMRAVHNLDFSRTRRHGEVPMTEAQKREVPPVAHPVVRTHPVTGRRCLFLGDHAEYIEGIDYDAGRALIESLNAEAVRNSPVYTHHYHPGDLVIWDNRCTMHCATEFDTAAHRRVMRRCTTLGDAPR